MRTAICVPDGIVTSRVSTIGLDAGGGLSGTSETIGGGAGAVGCGVAVSAGAAAGTGGDGAAGAGRVTVAGFRSAVLRGFTAGAAGTEAGAGGAAGASGFTSAAVFSGGTVFASVLTGAEEEHPEKIRPDNKKGRAKSRMWILFIAFKPQRFIKVI